LIDPAVARVQKLLRSRPRAIAVIYLLLLVAIGLFVLFVGPRISRQSARLAQNLPGLMDNASTGQIAQLVDRISRQHGWSAATENRIQESLSAHRDDVYQFAQRVGVRVAEAAQGLWVLVIVPILSIFFLRDGGNFHGVLVSLVQSRSQREFLEDVLHDLNQMLAEFIRAQLILAALTFVVYSSVLGIMRFPYALMLGTAAGALEFVPVAGPLVASVTVMAVALLTGYSAWPWLLLFLIIWRLLQDYVFSPRIMGASVELHPLAALFGVLAGAEIAGVLGVYLSIPVMASLRIVWRRWRIYAEKRKFGPLSEAFPHEIGNTRL